MLPKRSGSLPFIPLVRPMTLRIEPCEVDRTMRRRRSAGDWLFRRRNGYRRILSRLDKLDVMFLDFISVVLVVDSLRLRRQALTAAKIRCRCAHHRP